MILELRGQKGKGKGKGYIDSRGGPTILELRGQKARDVPCEKLQN